MSIVETDSVLLETFFSSPDEWAIDSEGVQEGRHRSLALFVAQLAHQISLEIKKLEFPSVETGTEYTAFIDVENIDGSLTQIEKNVWAKLVDAEECKNFPIERLIFENDKMELDVLVDTYPDEVSHILALLDANGADMQREIMERIVKIVTVQELHSDEDIDTAVHVLRCIGYEEEGSLEIEYMMHDCIGLWKTDASLSSDENIERLLIFFNDLRLSMKSRVDRCKLQNAALESFNQDPVKAIETIRTNLEKMILEAANHAANSDPNMHGIGSLSEAAA